MLNIEITCAARATTIRREPYREHSVDLPDTVGIIYPNTFANARRDAERMSTKANSTTVSLLFYDDILYVARAFHLPDPPSKADPLSHRDSIVP
jgi:isopropylmalate/homocitrate/citramalate synthase